MIDAWYIPSWHGDFRIVAHAEGGCAIEVERPTSAEIVVLRSWITQAKKNGWLNESMENAIRNGDSIQLSRAAGAPLDVPLAVAATLMAKTVHYKRQGVITAFAFANGKVQVAEVLEASKLPWLKKLLSLEESALVKPTALEEKISAELEKEDTPTKAVTVARPSLSCPECSGRSEGERKACDVLYEFLDPRQREEWRAERAITAFGGLTGHCYRIAARDTKQAAKTGRCVFDLDDRVILHNYHYVVPPEEEVLTLKLMLEHRENWLRVRGEVDPVARARQVFESPWPYMP